MTVKYTGEPTNQGRDINKSGQIWLGYGFTSQSTFFSVKSGPIFHFLGIPVQYRNVVSCSPTMHGEGRYQALQTYNLVLGFYAILLLNNLPLHDFVSSFL